ncbi:hypothetical protein FVP74_07440 [Microbacterium saccharophilum]|uniref:Uncharacterized protein n=1 Tax=Microbacterium saccharophilum TaxID=1213358 RepID=A0A5C8I8T6_9MICO|nr:hypothetical protein [Microbacterium saccharophilum]TXK14384.1 hypothetical protein FVP74_07440 [Microbacterium saccharophilum]GEP49272.1 hypothetical protein MSA03_27800 [Microbacterium saccharophilum]
MSESAPLRHLLEPGEYRVQWTIPSREGGEITLEGDLELIADRPPRAHAYGEIPDTYSTGGPGERVASFPQSYAGGLVRGHLLNGQHVLLVDTTIDIVFPERAVLHARAALVGRDPAPKGDLSVTKVKAQVEALDAVTAIPPIRKTKVPMQVPPGKRHLDWSWKAYGHPDSTQTWADADAAVEIRFLNSYSAADWYAFRVTFSPVVLITPSVPLTFDAVFDDWIEPLRRIISLSTGRRERLTYVSVTLAGESATTTDDEEAPEFQVYGSAIHQDPYASRGADAGRLSPVFRFSPQGMSLLRMLRRWQELAAGHHPLLESYASLMYARDQHPRSRLLLLIQAIEGLYGYETADAYQSRRQAHQARREEILAHLAQSQDEDTMRFVKKHLLKSPPASLEEALGKTLKAAPVNIVPVLKATPLLAGHESVPTGLRVIRNDLAHGNRGYPAEDLYEIVGPLDGVVRAKLLGALGCGESIQRRAQEKSA